MTFYVVLGVGEQKKRNLIEVEGWINDFFCFVPPSVRAKFEFQYIEIGPLRKLLNYATTTDGFYLL